MKAGKSKYLLRELAKRRLPPSSFSAPKKGFGIPLRAWLFSEPDKSYFKNLVCQSKIFKPGCGERFWHMAEINAALVASVFRIIALELWLDANQTQLWRR